MTHLPVPKMGDNYLYCAICKKYLMDRKEAEMLKSQKRKREYLKYIDQQHLNNSKKGIN